MLRVPRAVDYGASTQAELENQRRLPFKGNLIWDSQRRSHENPTRNLDLLKALITSKTSLKLLLLFFLNQNLSRYRQGLSKELEENTNSIRLELNRLQEAGLLSYELQGRRMLYQVNLSHPHTSDITSIVRKVFGIDTLVEELLENLPDIKQVWICGGLAGGVSSGSIDCILICKELDASYIDWLNGKAYELIG